MARDVDNEEPSRGGRDGDGPGHAEDGADGIVQGRTSRRGLRIIVRNEDGTHYDASDDEELVTELVEALGTVVPGPECDEAERQLAEALRSSAPQP